MSDLEITRLCAEAMGWKHLGAVGVPVPTDKNAVGGLWCMSGANDWWIDPEGHSVCGPCSGIPDPLHDDAQAMALVKKFTLRIDRTRRIPEKWGVWSRVNYGDATFSDDLNRAICTSIANMQKAKA